MKKLLLSVILVILVFMVLVAGITIFGLLPLMIFADSIEDAIRDLTKAIVS